MDVYEGIAVESTPPTAIEILPRRRWRRRVIIVSVVAVLIAGSWMLTLGVQRVREAAWRSTDT